MKMERLKRSLSFRKKKDRVPECSKPHQWQEDERKVREGTCSFQVRYLGCIEVFESRGMQVCEEAVKVLKARPKRKRIFALLNVGGDALKVVEDFNRADPTSLFPDLGKATKSSSFRRRFSFRRSKRYKPDKDIPKPIPGQQGLIVDQTIEKVSFCAPDRNHEKGFAYICRDGTTRRWMCHGFLTLKESGERLSHAVGCAFAICLERKQKRDKDSGVTVQFNQDRTSFTRTGSFRQTTMTERITDPQSALVAEPIPVQHHSNPYAVQRPHATANMLERQGSFRGFSKLAEVSSPFKRQLSLRLNELPSTLQRQGKSMSFDNADLSNGPVSPIKEEMREDSTEHIAQQFSQQVSPNNNNISKEASPAPEQQDSIAQMCQELTQGLSALSSTEDPFLPKNHSPGKAGSPAPSSLTNNTDSLNSSVTTSPAPAVRPPMGPQPKPIPVPIRQTNPWGGIGGGGQRAAPAPPPPAAAPPTGPTISEADFWLSSTAQQTHIPPVGGGAGDARVNGTLTQTSQIPVAAPGVPPSALQVQRPPHLAAHTRSHSVDAADFFTWNQRKPTLRELSQRPNVQQFQSVQNGSNWPGAQAGATGQAFQDPFDVAWAAKGSPDRKAPQQTAASSAATTNPFNANSVKAFEVKL